MESTETREKHEEKQAKQHALLKRLFGELVQAERSAMKHPRREADRLGAGPPAQALAAVSEHAEQRGAVGALGAHRAVEHHVARDGEK